MMGRIARASVHRRALVVVIAGLVTVFGVLQLGHTEVDSLPEFTPPFVEVQTEALGLSAAEVEQLITVPLEADLLNGVAWLESIRSESMPGLSSIVMTFEPGTDLLRARQMVQERLTQAAGLPNVSRAPAMVQPLSSEGRVMMIGLTSDELSLIDMSVLTRWTVRPFLMGIPGVANVSVWGQRAQQLQVRVDPADLAEEDLTLLDVVKTTGNALWVSPLSYLEASTPGTGGFIDGPNQRIGVQHVFAIDSPDDLAAVPVEGSETLTIGDVSSVVEDHQPLIGDAVVDGGPGLLLIVEKFPWGNTAETTEAVEEALDDLAPGLSGLTVDTDLFRPASYLQRTIDNIQVTAAVALLLVAAVLFLLFAGWRAALVSLAGLIVSLVGVGLVLYAMGTTMDTMAFAGLVLATVVIIGDGIGDADAMRRGLAESDDDEPTGDRVSRAVTRARRPLVYAGIVLVVLLIPAFVADGAAGEFLPTIVLNLALVLIVSMIVGLTVAPALGAMLDDVGNAPHREAPALVWLRGPYQRLVSKAVGSLPVALAVVAVVAIAGIASVPTVDRDFVPQFQQTDLLVNMEAAAGTSLGESERIVSLAVNELRELPGVDDVGALLGRAVLSDEVSNVNSSQLWVRTDPDADYDATIDAIDEVVQGYPGFEQSGTLTYTNQRVDDVLQQPIEDLVVRVYGEEPVQLGETAADMAELVAGVDGTTDVRLIQPVAEPSIEIEVDLDRAADYHVKPGDVRRAAATLLSGIEVGSLFDDQKVFEVVVWSEPDVRNSVTDVERLMIDTPSGDVVELSEVADVRVAPVETVIQRDAVSRYIDVVADVSGRGLGSVESDIEEAVAADGLPFEYHIRILEDRNDATANQRQVLAVALTVLVAALLLLQAAFDSWRLALLLLATTPLALAGGLVAMAISGDPYSLGSAIGFIAVAGLTLRAALTVVDRFETLQRDEPDTGLADVVTRGRATSSCHRS